MKRNWYILGCTFICVVVLLLIHFRKDIFYHAVNYYILESSQSVYKGKESKSQIILLSDVPHFHQNRRKILEDLFWQTISLDSLIKYNSYIVYYYQETKYLTQNFKEGAEYKPLYSHWDNTMDWRNHLKDRVGIIQISTREVGTGNYYVTIYDSGYGIRLFVDIVKRYHTYQDFNDIKDFYIKKCKELGIKKNDIENNENF